jgi:hypothetical protein
MTPTPGMPQFFSTHPALGIWNFGLLYVGMAGGGGGEDSYMYFAKNAACFYSVW